MIIRVLRLCGVVVFMNQIHFAKKIRKRNKKTFPHFLSYHAVCDIEWCKVHISLRIRN